MNSAPDLPRRFSALASGDEDWEGTAALEWQAGGRAGGPLRLTEANQGDDQSISFKCNDSVTGLEVVQTWRLNEAGILGIGHSLRNAATSGEPIEIAAIRALMPLPERAAEVLDMTGRWTAERRPQRAPLGFGTHWRAARRGRPGHDAPDLMVAGTAGFAFRSGEVWAAHLAWSGDSQQFVERLAEGAGAHAAVIGAGEALAPGEIRLAPGETHEAPEALFAWSNAGLDGLSQRFHQHVRALEAHPATPRPLVLNTWEAVYFNQHPEELAALAQRAADVGVELFVLDDGWFLSRRDDSAGLGDWQADPTVWPDGIGHLAQTVHALGMRFGLWFEPEMANLDSELARTHADWLQVAPSAEAATWRRQVPVNLAHPEAYAYLLEHLDAAVRSGVDFIKWDHNRDIAQPRDRRTGAAGGHAQVEAVYRLMAELRSRHPHLELESCASGGGRADLGIAARTQRVWMSDTNDPLERQRIQRWAGLVLPPERIGSHVSGARAHTTGRVTDLSFRLATALFAHAGIEWDIREASDQELATLRRWAELYKELRPLIHGGVTVRADLGGRAPGQAGADRGDQGVYLHGVVSPSQDHALFAWVRLDTSASADTARVRFPGLDPARTYRVRVRGELGLPAFQQITPPAWLSPALDAAALGASGCGASSPDVELPGELLTQVGVPLPNLRPGQALLLEFA
jgi:alpha-galactosidase